MEFTKYSHYTLQDFLNDEDFIQWVNQPTAESNALWAGFVKLYPQQEAGVVQASAIITAYKKQKVFDNAGRQEAVWNRIAADLNNGHKKQAKVFALPALLRVAAVLTVICSITAVLWYYNSNQTITTAAGEVRSVTLPDNSIVTLNGSSSIKFARNWGNAAREIWIDGEGLFQVVHLNTDTRHIKASETFIVHCNDLNIRVLGTTFNVKSRHGKTAVGLINGKIRLEYLHDTINNYKAVILKPGDYASYTKNKRFKMERLARPNELSQWKEHAFVFVNPTIQDIADELVDNYGYQVNIPDNAVAARRIEGEINVPNVQELLETTATSLHVKIENVNKTITIINN